MNVRLSLLIWFFVIAVAHADSSQDEEAFLVVPGATDVNYAIDDSRIHRSNDDDRLLKTSDLPKQLIKLLEDNDLGATYGTSDFRGFAFDLNKDGKSEYFIFDRACSGSGGPAYRIFGCVDHQWRGIGDFQGSLHMFPVRKGWPCLVSIGRGGGGCWTKSYMEFKKGEYKTLFYERYVRGTITWERLPQK